MSNKNEVFEYLIDQLRQQVTKKDVISFNVSVRISDLDDVKQVIHNLQQHIAGKDDEIRALKDSLRQQVNNNQCEDLAHEVQSLKNQLRDASAQIKELHLALATATGDVGAYKLIRKGEHGLEQSGCRKEDTQDCEHEWYFYDKGASMMCRICGLKSPDRQKEDTQKCEHDWVEFHGLFIAEGDPRNEPGYTFCRKCGLKEYSRKCEHEWSYVMGDGPGFYECDVCGARSETLPYDLRWLA